MYQFPPIAYLRDNYFEGILKTVAIVCAILGIIVAEVALFQKFQDVFVLFILLVGAAGAAGGAMYGGALALAFLYLDYIVQILLGLAIGATVLVLIVRALFIVVSV